MRAIRSKLIESGLPNKTIEQDVIGNVAAEFDVSRQTVSAVDYLIAEIDGQSPVLRANIVRKAVAEATGE
jgi:hypothetical protein